MILGCCGSGKTTLANELNRYLNLELIHLDKFYWKPCWIESGYEEWKNAVREFADKDSWIMDGNYSGTIDLRIKRADTIIYLDASTIKCLTRIFNRIIKNYGRVRPEMPDGCFERFDWGFIKFVSSFNRKKREFILKKLSSIESGKNVFIIRKRTDYLKLIEKVKKHSECLTK
jgi:adenylate kinase family enzyme